MANLTVLKIFFFYKYAKEITQSNPLKSQAKKKNAGKTISPEKSQRMKDKIFCKQYKQRVEKFTFS
jgi:hypothetical protein